MVPRLHEAAAGTRVGRFTDAPPGLCAGRTVRSKVRAAVRGRGTDATVAIVRDRDDRVGSTGCLWKTFVVVVALGAVAVATPAVFDQASKRLSGDVCEQSDVDLIRRAGSGNIDGVRHELETTKVDQQDQFQNTALGCAIPRHRSEVTTELLARGADANKTSGAGADGELPIELAYDESDTATLSALLDRGADPNLHRHSDTLIIRAIRDDKEPILVALVAHHPDVDGTPDGRPVLRAASSTNPRALKLILDAKPNLSLPATTHDSTSVGQQALELAAGSGNVDGVTALLMGGVDPNASAYLSPLLRSITFRHGEVTKRLLEAGADPNLGESDLLSLYVNVHGIDKALADELPLPEQLGSTVRGTAPHSTGSIRSPSEYPRFQVPPLAAALTIQDNASVRLLLDHGADANRIAADRFSPLYIAARTCNVDAAKLLLEHGARPSLSPADHDPKVRGCPAILDLLRE